MTNQTEFRLEQSLFSQNENGCDMDHCAFRCCFTWLDTRPEFNEGTDEFKTLEKYCQEKRQKQCSKLPEWVKNTVTYNWLATKADSIALELSVDFNENKVVAHLVVNESGEISYRTDALTGDFPVFVEKHGLKPGITPKGVQEPIKNALAPTGQGRKWSLEELGEEIDKEESAMWDEFYLTFEALLVESAGAVLVEFRAGRQTLASFNLDEAINKLQSEGR